MAKPAITPLTSAQQRAIRAHVRRQLGNVRTLVRNFQTRGLRVDLLIVRPSRKFPYTALITLGMSAMSLERDARHNDWVRPELCVVLPPDWPRGRRTLLDPRSAHSWPARWLRHFARPAESWPSFYELRHAGRRAGNAKNHWKGSRFVAWIGCIPMATVADTFKAKSMPFQHMRRGTFAVQFSQLIPMYREEKRVDDWFDGDEFFSILLNHDMLDWGMLCDPSRVNLCANAKHSRHVNAKGQRVDELHVPVWVRSRSGKSLVLRTLRTLRVSSVRAIPRRAKRA